MDPMEQIKAGFFQECQELLADLETGLMAIESGDSDLETINAVFRAVHSVKGGAGAFGLDDLVQFAHVFETTLDEMRSGRLAASETVVKVMLRSSDMLADHVTAAQTGGSVDMARSAGLEAELTALTQEEGASAAAAPAPAAAEPVFTPMPAPSIAPAAPAGDEFGFTPMKVEIAPLGAGAPLPPLSAPAAPVADEFGFTPMKVAIEEAVPVAAPKGWRVVFRPASDMYAKANDVAPLLREMERLGPCTVSLDADALPEFEVLEPETAYLAWTVELAAACPRSSVEEVFEFVDGDCDLTITEIAGEAVAAPAAPALNLDDVLANIRQPQGKPDPSVQSLIDHVVPAIAAEAIVPLNLDDVLANAREAPAAAPSEGQVQQLIDQVVPAIPAAPVSAPAAAPAASAPAAAPAAAAGGGEKQGAEGGATTAAATTIRVDLERVDRLIDLVGELVINQAMLAQRVGESGFARSSNVAVGLDELEQLTREIQDSVMAIRAQPVKSVFQRIPRMVREIALATGKQARLVTEGEGTEVDKTVIERLSDPITHMIRNAIDHGLESPEDRVAAGKPAEGTVRLAALHRSGRIVIEVSDDGKGINRERVRQIAIDKGLLDPDAQLTDDETDNLLFLPGFSTASTISNISGRGVGMDVVKRSIQALGGRISISSVPGKGSTFTMSLPLTLAVLDGMVVSVGEQTLVAPLTTIIETLQPKPADIRTLGPNARVVAVRDSYVPLIDVGAVLGWRTEVSNAATGVCLLVENEAGGRAALLVDTIQGQRQVVIKSLEANYQQVAGIAAATILGDGRVALILDVDAVIALRGANPSPSLALAS